MTLKRLGRYTVHFAVNIYKSIYTVTQILILISTSESSSFLFFQKVLSHPVSFLSHVPATSSAHQSKIRISNGLTILNKPKNYKICFSSDPNFSVSFHFSPLITLGYFNLLLQTFTMNCVLDEAQLQLSEQTGITQTAYEL